VKNWDVTACQILLLSIGGYYVWQAMLLISNTSASGSLQAFVLTISIGTVLVGLALALQEIRSYRARKTAVLIVPPPKTNESKQNVGETKGEEFTNPLDQLKKLKELLEIDTISTEEYEEKKKKLLDSV
jgi:hypothetical protein